MTEVTNNEKEKIAKCAQMQQPLLYTKHKNGYLPIESKSFIFFCCFIFMAGWVLGLCTPVIYRLLKYIFTGVLI